MLNHIDMEIYKKIKMFRKGMLRVKIDGYQFSLLDQFPKDCCEFASYLLAKFLIEELGISQVKLLRGENRFKKEQRHVWLQVGILDIDITANQFYSTNKTLFVEPNSKWHKRYSVFETENPDPSFDQFHEEHKFELLQDYEDILRQIKALTN
jgi:hypothetical protein